MNENENYFPNNSQTISAGLVNLRLPHVIWQTFKFMFFQILKVSSECVPLWCQRLSAFILRCHVVRAALLSSSSACHAAAHLFHAKMMSGGHLMPPEGRSGMCAVSPLSGISGLSFDSTLLSPLMVFCLVLLPFLSYRFLPADPFV